MKGIEILKQQIEEMDHISDELKTGFLVNVQKMFEFQAYMLGKMETDESGLEMMFGFHMQAHMQNEMITLNETYEEAGEGQEITDQDILDVMREGVNNYVTKHEYPEAEDFTNSYMGMMTQIKEIYKVEE